MTNDIFYVYYHVDPFDKEVVYVGKGKYGRAWDVTRSRCKNHEHMKWMKQLTEEGLLPSNWVRIIASGLSEKDAYRLEKEQIQELGGPRFNGQVGDRNNKAKLTNHQAREIYNRSKTEVHSKLAEEFGVSRTCISMIASRKQWRTATSCLITQN